MVTINEKNIPDAQVTLNELSKSCDNIGKGLMVAAGVGSVVIIPILVLSPILGIISAAGLAALAISGNDIQQIGKNINKQQQEMNSPKAFFNDVKKDLTVIHNEANKEIKGKWSGFKAWGNAIWHGKGLKQAYVEGKQADVEKKEKEDNKNLKKSVEIEINELTKGTMIPSSYYNAAVQKIIDGVIKAQKIT